MTRVRPIKAHVAQASSVRVRRASLLHDWRNTTKPLALAAEMPPEPALRMPALHRALAALVMACALANSSAASLQIVISPKVAGEDVQPDSLRYRTSAGENFSITRVSGLVSDF